MERAAVHTWVGRRHRRWYGAGEQSQMEQSQMEQSQRGAKKEQQAVTVESVTASQGAERGEVK